MKTPSWTSGFVDHRGRQEPLDSVESVTIAFKQGYGKTAVTISSIRTKCLHLLDNIRQHYRKIRAVGSLVVRAPTHTPENRNSTAWGTGENFLPLQFQALIGEVEIDGGAIYWNVRSSLREFHRTKSCCHLYGAQG
ncbi:hypothetical protein TNCV_855651 [Trichonephila clavipes]|nr:hypothetical protein TNCV_855651 [Trichonephila clavipes]